MKKYRKLENRLSEILLVLNTVELVVKMVGITMKLFEFLEFSEFLELIRNYWNHTGIYRIIWNC